MKFIFANSLSEASSFIDKEGALLLKGMVKDDRLSPVIRLPEYYTYSPSNIFEYAYRHQDKISYYLKEVHDPYGGMWEARVLSFLPDLYCIGYNTPSHQQEVYSPKCDVITRIFSILDRISGEYFLIFPQARNSSAITDMPSCLLRQNGFILNDMGKEHFFFSIMSLISIFETLEKEISNEAKGFQKSVKENEKTFIFLLEKDLFATEYAVRSSITEIINIILKRKPPEIEIINKIDIPLGSLFDMEDTMSLAVHGYISELDEQDNLKVYTK